MDKKTAFGRNLSQPPPSCSFYPSPQSVQLLGIAQRRIHAKFNQKQGNEKYLKPLQINMETIGDWIKVQRIQKNLTSGHVAAKMGIAQSVVRSWERGASYPDKLQLEVLRDIFGFDPKTETALITIIFPSNRATEPLVGNP